MKKIKDFLYDKNDILIAVLILVVAAAIIAWRMDVILQYPKQLINSGTTVDTPTVDPSDINDSDADHAEDAPQTPDGSQNQNGTGSGGDSSNTGDSAQQGTELWMAGALTRDVDVDVTGNTATAAIQCLIDAGLFKDYAEYKKICDASGLNDEKVSGGAFTFKKGSTKEAIAKKINWS